MKSSIYIAGYKERLNQACLDSGLSKSEIARRAGFNRKILCPTEQVMMGSGYLAKFCAVTRTDANWLLGIKRG